MVWPGPGGNHNRAPTATVKEMHSHYNGGVVHLTRSTSYGREIVASRLNEKHKAANTKKHQLQLPSHHHHHHGSSPDTDNNKRRWSWGKSKSSTEKHDDDAIRRRPPQTPNHRVSAGRAFADRMIRTASPTRKRNIVKNPAPQKSPNDHGPPKGIFPLTTAALTTTKPLPNLRQNPGQNNSHYSSIDTSLQSQDIHLSPEYRDDVGGNQENAGGVAGNSMASMSPIHELSDRISRIEQRLYEEERSPPPKSVLRRKRDHSRNSSPSKLWSHQTRNGPQQSQSTCTSHPRPYTYRNDHHKDPPSSTSTPTLFAHTKQKMTKDSKSADSCTSSFSEVGVEPMAMARQILEFQQMQIEKGTKRDGDDANATETSKNQTKVFSKTPSRSLLHAAVHPYGPQTETHVNAACDDDDDDDDDGSAAPLPPTPKTSNGHGHGVASLSDDSQDQEQQGQPQLVKENHLLPRQHSQEQQTTKAGGILQRQLSGVKFSSLSCQGAPPSPIKKELIQPQSQTTTESQRRKLLTQLPLPNSHGAPAAERKDTEETNSILASVHNSSSQPVDTIQGVISDLSSSTTGHTASNKNTTARTSRTGTTNGSTTKGGGQLTMTKKGASLAIPSMTCLVSGGIAGQVKGMKRLCAGDTGSQISDDDESQSCAADVVVGEVVTMVPGIAVTSIPREIPLVPRTLTPDVSLMDHPDHASVQDEDLSPRKPIMMKSSSPLKMMESRKEQMRQEIRGVPPRPLPQKLHMQTVPQATIPNVPSLSDENETELAQQYFETMYVEAEKTQDVLQDLLQTPQPQEASSSVMEDLLIESMSPLARPTPKSSSDKVASVVIKQGMQKRVLFCSSLPEELGTSGPNAVTSRLLPRRKSVDKSRTRPPKTSLGGTTKHRETEGDKPEKISSSRDLQRETLRGNKAGALGEKTRKCGENVTSADATRSSNRINVSLQPKQNQTRKIPPSTLLRGGDRIDTRPSTDTTKPDDRLQRQQELDDARMDILLFNQSAQFGDMKKCKLSPYHPKSETSGKRNWFGRRQHSEAGHTFGGSSKSSKSSKNGRVLEPKASSVDSAITADSAISEGPRTVRRGIVQVSNDSSGSYHSLEQSRGESDASSGMSFTSGSAMSDPPVEDAKDPPGKGGIVRATTYDDIIQDLKKFESHLPSAEFAVVEVGDDDDAVAAHTYLVNKTSVENELRSGYDRDGPLMVEMPFGLETITEHSLEASYSMGTNSEGEEARAVDDSSLDNVKLSVSFAEQLQQIQMIQRRKTPSLKTPTATYHI